MLKYALLLQDFLVVSPDLARNGIDLPVMGPKNIEKLLQRMQSKAGSEFKIGLVVSALLSLAWKPTDQDGESLSRKCAGWRTDRAQDRALSFQVLYCCGAECMRLR